MSRLPKLLRVSEATHAKIEELKRRASSWHTSGSWTGITADDVVHVLAKLALGESLEGYAEPRIAKNIDEKRRRAKDLQRGKPRGSAAAPGRVNPTSASSSSTSSSPAAGLPRTAIAGKPAAGAGSTRAEDLRR